MNNDKKISAIILAGGKGSRMDNKDKGLQVYQGISLIEHCISLLEPQSDEIVISCNRNIEEYGRYQLPIAADENTDFDGPLAGILAAGLVCQQPLIFICPCDMPRLPKDITIRMEALLSHEGSDMCICFDGKRKQNLVMLFKASCLQSLRLFLSSGERKVGLWQDNWLISELDCSHQESLFLNINTVEDLKSVN